MKFIQLSLTVILSTLLLSSASSAQDWAKLNHYKKANYDLPQLEKGEQRIVFMGNSITEEWSTVSPDFFGQPGYLNRGIGGQTSSQMLVRFRTDVIYLNPSIVIILAGINDIAENTGPITPEMILANIISMVELAQANDITTILASVLPAESFIWRPEIKPVEKIVDLNELIKLYAKRAGLVYLDYYSHMVNRQGGLKHNFTRDGVHPNKAGYRKMAILAKAAINKALPGSSEN